MAFSSPRATPKEAMSKMHAHTKTSGIATAATGVHENSSEPMVPRKEERKNVDEELVALLLSFPEKQAAAILKAVTQDHFWDLPESEQVELLRRCLHE